MEGSLHLVRGVMFQVALVLPPVEMTVYNCKYNLGHVLILHHRIMEDLVLALWKILEMPLVKFNHQLAEVRIFCLKGKVGKAQKINAVRK